MIEIDLDKITPLLFLFWLICIVLIILCKCPNCGRNVYYNGFIYTFPHKICAKYGYDLDNKKT